MSASKMALVFSFWLLGGLAGTAAESGQPLNILLITADDLNYDSLGVTGCKTPEITPHLDRLAGQGMLFQRAHVTIAVCQPCREVLMTGRYPHRNGGMGFEPIRGKRASQAKTAKPLPRRTARLSGRGS